MSEASTSAARPGEAVGLPVVANVLEKELLTIYELSQFLNRSVSSLEHDTPRSNIPAPKWIGGRKFWSLTEIREWIALDCPVRKDFEARSKSRRSARA
jgi:predicted DNA-binding transcriptional regulator AlpA